MPRVPLTVLAALLSLLIGQVAQAKTLYTWTDENGVVHISEAKPPAGTQPTDKVTYSVKPGKQEAQVESRKADQQRALMLEYDARQQVHRLRREADRAKIAMEKAIAEANALKAKTDEYIQQWGAQARYRKSIKAKIDRQKEATNEAVAESERLIKIATQAEEKVRAAEKELSDLQKLTGESQAYPKPPESKN